MWIGICLQTQWTHSNNIFVTLLQACLLFVSQADKWIKYQKSGSPERAKGVDPGVCPWLTESGIF